MEFPPSYKLQKHTYEVKNFFKLKEDDPSQKMARINYAFQDCLI